MSGPAAASFGLEAIAVMAAAEAILAAQEIAEGYAAEGERRESERNQRRAERHRLRQAAEAGRRALADRVAARQARLRCLADAWSALGRAGLDASAPPLPPEEPEALARHLAWLEERIAAFEAAFGALAGELPAADLSALLAAGVSAEEQLAAHAAGARLAGAADSEVRRATAARLLERVDLDAGEPLPPELDALAARLIGAERADRAEALASELRLQVQRHNEARAAGRRAAAEAAEKEKLDEAAALVLEQSLRDLGYEVEDIDATLFLEGGLVHFQRPGWGDYHVRLRVAPERQAMHFNVVRAAGSGDDRTREDMMAEERWCAEFPRLFETLKARGIRVDVTRMLQAGEAPVQQVDPASLPRRREEEDRRAAPPQARSAQ